MLIDDISIRVAAGHGGRGASVFNKTMMSLGPAGGRGGNGGSVYLVGVSNIDALSQFRNRKDFNAENGREGRGQFRDGNNADDLVLQVPVGTVAHNLTTGETIEIEHMNKPVCIAKGGFGGKGNYLFRSPRNTSPTQFQPGLPGEAFDFRLELKLIADVGFVGLPNAGKSSMLNELTNASAKVANYPFTTLEPNLGVHFDLILADIPGLIEGSSEGKGLGIKFLRHVERTGILFHFVSAESSHPVADYRVIRKELGAYNKSLLKKTEYLFLSKMDVISPADVKKKLASLKKLNKNAIAISIYDLASVEKINKILNKIAKKK